MKKKTLLSENASIFYKNYIDGIKKLEEELAKSQEEKNLLKVAIKKLEVSNKRGIKYEKILNLTPETDDGIIELYEYFSEKILPFIIKKNNSKYTSKIIEYLDNAIINAKDFNKIESDNTNDFLELSVNNFYVYSHTIEGDNCPFYIGYSANNDNSYKRSKDFSGRSFEWCEYLINNNRRTYDIRVDIIAEVNTAESALELEKYYIKHYAEGVVNKKHNK